MGTKRPIDSGKRGTAGQRIMVSAQLQAGGSDIDMDAALDAALAEHPGAGLTDLNGQSVDLAVFDDGLAAGVSELEMAAVSGCGADLEAFVDARKAGGTYEEFLDIDSRFGSEACASYGRALNAGFSHQEYVEVVSIDHPGNPGTRHPIPHQTPRRHGWMAPDQVAALAESGVPVSDIQAARHCSVRAEAYSRLRSENGLDHPLATRAAGMDPNVEADFVALIDAGWSQEQIKATEMDSDGSHGAAKPGQWKQALKATSAGATPGEVAEAFTDWTPEGKAYEFHRSYAVLRQVGATHAEIGSVPDTDRAHYTTARGEARNWGHASHAEANEVLQALKSSKNGPGPALGRYVSATRTMPHTEALKEI